MSSSSLAFNNSGGAPQQKIIAVASKIAAAQGIRMSDAMHEARELLAFKSQLSAPSPA